MSKSNQQCWVIKKGKYYVNAGFKALFTGRTTGFVGYDKDKEGIMKKDLEMLGEGYYAEYINFREIPDGERIYLD
jgi:hypothetical protein